MSDYPADFPFFSPQTRYGFTPGERVGYHVSGSKLHRIPARFILATVVAEDATTGALYVRNASISGQDASIEGPFFPDSDQVLRALDIPARFLRCAEDDAMLNEISRGIGADLQEIADSDECPYCGMRRHYGEC